MLARRHSLRAFGNYAMKSTALALFVALLAPVLTGCVCTTFTLNRSSETRWDTFSPSAVYKRANPVSFALAGVRHNQSESFDAFLVIPDKFVTGARLQNNQTLSPEEIRKMYDAISLEQKTPRSIPVDFQMVAVLPKNDLRIDVERRRPEGGWGYLVPFAFIADVATFPVQAICWACGGIPNFM